MVDQKMEGNLHIRLPQKSLDKFRKKAQAETSKPHQELLREIIEAFNNDRLRVMTNDKKTGVLYD